MPQGLSGDGGPYERREPGPGAPVPPDGPPLRLEVAPAKESIPSSEVIPSAAKKESSGRSLSQDVFVLMDSRYGTSPATRPAELVQLGTSANDGGGATTVAPSAASTPPAFAVSPYGSLSVNSSAASSSSPDSVCVSDKRTVRRVNRSGKGHEVLQRVQELSSTMASMVAAMQEDIKAANERDRVMKALFLEEMRACAERDRVAAERERQRADDERLERALLLRFMESNLHPTPPDCPVARAPQPPLAPSPQSPPDSNGNM